MQKKRNKIGKQLLDKNTVRIARRDNKKRDRKARCVDTMYKKHGSLGPIQ